MSFEAKTAEARALFETGWVNGGSPRTQIAWPDVDFTPPDGASWVRFDMKHNDAYQASVGSPGSNKFRRVGIVTIQIFTPPGNATKTARQLADFAVAIFQGVQTSGGIVFYDVGMREVGKDPNGWLQTNVVASFRYDETA